MTGMSVIKTFHQFDIELHCHKLSESTTNNPGTGWNLLYV